MRALAFLALAVPAIASATPPKAPVTVKIPLTAEHAQTAGVLYFNRCRGGCTVTKSATDDVRTRASTIPRGNLGEQFTLTEWAHGDQAWNELMQCLREVYSPYNVMVTDQQPAPGVAYNENIVAGSDDEINYNAGGVSPVTGDCSPFSYVISYTFANDYPPNIYTLCYVAAQETGHSYGMADHAWAYISDGRSACNDPTSYRVDCLSNGQRFFRNGAVTCGDFNQTTCNCSGMNSHLKLLGALGPGQSLIPAPTVSIDMPAAGATIQNGAAVIASAYSKRGVDKVELWLNGYKWAESRGASFNATEQPETAYSLPIPAMVPNSVLDIEVVAKDDIGETTTSSKITVTKGAPCADASTCLDGQKCEAGKCFWDPPAGEVGDACTYPQFCKTGMCIAATDGEQLCSQTCVPGTTDSCPMGFDCLETGGGQGACWPESSGGGCCSTSRDAAAQSALLAFGLVLLLRRRRRR
jgi:hypothetical protein